LRVLYPFVGDTIGGSHISALALIRDLPRDAVEPLVVLHHAGPLADYLDTIGVTSELAPGVELVSPGNLLMQTTGMLRGATRLARFARSRDIDIIHTNDLRMHRTWGVAAKLAGARFIWHQRSADSSRRLAFYSRLADRVLTVSHFCKSQLAGGMGRRAIVVRSPFEPPSPRPDQETARKRLLTELGADEPAFVVGFVGNLTQQKRPLVFVEMAARLCELTGRRLFFPMFGEPRQPMRQQVDSLIAERGLRGRCFLMGSRHPIEPWITACDVVVAPGVSEAFGRAMVEAALVGTPVVAAQHGGNSEILTHGETGLLVPVDEKDAFADAVLSLAENPERTDAMAKAAFESALARFSVRKHTETLVDLYAEVARREPYIPPSINA
jgi:glycosyltransferase involved in cell wall biosynthesis